MESIIAEAAEVVQWSLDATFQRSGHVKSGNYNRELMHWLYSYWILKITF